MAVTAALISCLLSVSGVSAAGSYGMLNYRADAINAFIVYSDIYPSGISALSHEFTGIVKRVKPAYIAYSEFESKRMTGYIISISGSLAALGLAVWGFSDGGGANTGLIIGGAAVAWASGLLSSMFIRDSDSAFYRCVHEYNRAAVSAFIMRGGGGIKKDVSF